MKLVNVQVIKNELERLIRNYWFLSSAEAKYRCVVYMELSEWLDGLDVKEVDLEKEIDDYMNEHFSECGDGVLISDASSTELTLLDATSIARHFFELGLKEQLKNK